MCDNPGMYEEITVRAASQEDTEAAMDIDDSFTTSSVMSVDTDVHGFFLREVPASTPIRKTFPADDEQEEELVRFIATTGDGTVCGKIAVEYESWNRRLTIANLALDPVFRGRGFGSVLVDRAVEYAQRLGALSLWLEVSNINTPAIRAYRRMGFELCGLDTSLYRGTPAEGEIALFMARSCQ